MSGTRMAITRIAAESNAKMIRSSIGAPPFDQNASVLAVLSVPAVGCFQRHNVGLGRVSANF